MKRIGLILVLILLACLPSDAQRKTQDLGRGVVAVNNGSNVTVTWRRLAQEPENAQYNVYVNGNKITSSPLSVTNYKTTTSQIPNGSQVAVTLVTTNKSHQQKESALSKAFTFKQNSLKNIFIQLTYKGGPLNNADYTTKYIWPCDLDGDGEMDYVVDRNPVSSDNTHKVEGYLSDGTYLWTVDMGVNESIGNGQDDQVCAWDFDCDGLGEVMLQTSDGTRFWDKENNTWGKYVFGKDTGDIDGDGIIDYNNQTTKNPPRYFTVVDGMTGAEQNSVEMTYNSHYNRTNKASLKGDEYNKHVGKFGLCYFDGIHPGVAMEWHTRGTNGDHYYYSEGFQYDFSSGKAGELKDIFQYGCGSGSFHSIRVGDVDFDGKDEMIEGGWTMDHTGKVLFNAGISHGDRFRTTDINPERPGLETFAIQQNAGDMLGQILYDATDGKAIKKWYLSAVGDVGRGDCYDMLQDHKGWEMFSTMDGNAIYDANGDATGQTGYFPTEALWWDGDLGREYLAAPDGNGYNAYIAKYGTGRLIQMASESGWKVKSAYGARAAFWGDIIGDWREEVLLDHYADDGSNDGFWGYTTDYTTTENRIYCLMEDPAYHGQMLCKGYYQTPMPFFYLGWDMPRPQLPPVMKADENNEVFDLTLGNATITPDAAKENIYVMAVKNQTLTISQALDGEFDLWKSQKGTLNVTAPIKTSGTVYISEGCLTSTSDIDAPVELRARGVLAGSPTVKGDVTIEGALNYDEGKLMPVGTMTFEKGLNVNNRLYIEYSKATDIVKVVGDLKLTAEMCLNITFPVEAGEYKLMEYTGAFTGVISKITTRGLTGYSYNILNKDNAIYLKINAQREPQSGVVWTGAENGTWDYQTANFAIDGTPVTFVAGDTVVFNDDAITKTIVMNELMPIGGVEFQNNTVALTFNGDGGFSGTGAVTFNGKGKVTLNTTKSDYTGKSIINAGTVTVKDLGENGVASPLGAGTILEMGKGTLIINNASTSTNRTVNLTDTATVQIASGTSAFKGQIRGKGRLVKKGGGQLNFTYAGSNSFSGGVELSAGTIAMGAWNTTFGTGRIQVTGNGTISIFNCNSTSTIPSFTNQLEIAEGKTVTVVGGQRCSVKPVLYGKGTMKISFPYVRGDFAPNGTNFEGTIEVTSGELRLAGALNMPNATLKLSGEDNVYNNSSAHKLGALTGTNTGATLSAGTWNVGYLNSDASFAGAVASGVALNKYGTGKLTLTGSSAGTLNVYEGVMDVENTSAATTTGLIYVRNGGLLRGAGKTQNVTVQNGGTLSAGKYDVTTGAIEILGNLTVQEGGKVLIRARGTTTSSVDHFTVTGATKLTNPVFEMQQLTGAWAEGEYQVFDGSGTITLIGDVTMQPAVPGDGLKWDLSELTSRGVVKVMTDTGIDDVYVEGDSSDIYNLRGQKVQKPTTGDVYISKGKKHIAK